MSDKKVFLVFILLNIFFININCFSLDSFSKSIYASIKESENLKTNLVKDTIDPDYLILKYENPLTNIDSPYINSMSLYLNPKFYHNIISLDSNDKINFFTLKNNILHIVSRKFYKIKEPYTLIEDNNHTIFERLEYFTEYLNSEDKNATYKNYWYNLINDLPMNNSKIPLIESLTNITLLEINKAIKDSFNKIGTWNEDISYELFFVYDGKKGKFILNKIFIYYIKNKSNEGKIYLNKFKFENVFFEQGNKIYNNVDFKSYIINDNYLANSDFKINISTNKKDSIYHNLMTLAFSEITMNNYYKLSKNNEVCFIIHYILTEDVYIERNEFIKRFEEILTSNGINKDLIKQNIKYDLYASKFIEQELSSDLSEQAYFTFVLYTNKHILDILNNTISFTMHFRYKPSLNINSNKTHISTIMPQPFVYIYNSDFSYEKNFINEILVKNNIFENEKNKSKKLEIFEEEIKKKKMIIFNQNNILKDNYLQLIHDIPAGQKKYFFIVTLVTIFTSLGGFLIIFMGVMNYISAPKEYYKNKKIE